MINKAFFLFPGQGAQKPGMALDLLETSTGGGRERIANLFSLATEIAGIDMADLLENSGGEALQRTDISQPAITLANLAAAAFLAGKGVFPSGCAGFSLGEYAALAVSGVISEEDCIKLVVRRGKVMQAAVDRLVPPGTQEAPGMAAVLGLPPDKVEAMIDGWKAEGNPDLNDLYAANFNSPGQTVVSGSAGALAKAENLFISAGARRLVYLKVAGPFHSPLMARAAEEFRPFLENIKFNDPRIPLFSNVSGRLISSGEEAKKLALLHITSAVRWTDEEAAIAGAASEGGIDCLLETGPGRVLQGLWKDSNLKPPCFAAGTAADILKICADF